MELSKEIVEKWNFQKNWWKKGTFKTIYMKTELTKEIVENGTFKRNSEKVELSNQAEGKWNFQKNW